ncbi:MAG: hypothetical protein NWT00_00970, partial [Beijerinckiaceae bacterium]|nr:hypothetical protein [Beijerinckiaceae bacterium]
MMKKLMFLSAAATGAAIVNTMDPAIKAIWVNFIVLPPAKTNSFQANTPVYRSQCAFVQMLLAGGCGSEVSAMWRLCHENSHTPGRKKTAQYSSHWAGYVGHVY